MIRYKSDIVEEARKLRLQKLSFKEISKVLKIPSNTIRNWCFGIRIDRYKSLRINNEYRRKNIKDTDKYFVPKIEDLSVEQARLYAALLYGCEGSKYPATNIVAFINSDPYLVQSFIKLIRKGFDLNENKFRVHLQVHTNHNFNEVKEFWSKLLNISVSQFLPPTITTPRGKMRRLNYLGTCSVRYLDYQIQLRLLGIFERFCGYGEVA